MTDTMDEIERDLSKARADLKESVSSLGDKLTLGQIVDEVLQKSGFDPASAKSALSEAARLTVPGAVLGAGVALLISNVSLTRTSKGRSASTSDDEESYYEFADDWRAHERYRAAVALEAEHARRADEDDAAHRRRLRTLQAGALGYARADDEDDAAFHDRVERGLHEAKESAARAAERLSEGAAKALTGAKRMANDVGDAARHVVSDAKQGVAKATASAKRSMRVGGERAEALYSDHPAASVALGLFVGAVLGSVVPLTRKEEELLGDAVGSAAAGLADAGERVAQDVGRGVHAAVEEHRQGAAI